MGSILVVDDDEQICSALRQFFELEGHHIAVASTGEEALRRIQDEPPDVVLMDVRMPGIDGLAALERMRELDPRIYVVMMTAYATSRTSIEAMRLGAFDHLLKPLDLHTVKTVIDRALEDRALSREVAAAQEREVDEESPVNLVGKSPKMQEVYKLIGLLAARGIPALLVGERGVGKRLVARTIHHSSGRSDQPFVALSCLALPEDELAVELFGREIGPEGRGGTVVSRGRLETTDGGTLLLEHVEALTLSLQMKLLRFLTESSFERIGGTSPVRSGTHLLAATEQDLGDSVRRGKFNEKLFDRLRVFSIHLPPLRERREDIPELVSHFLRLCNAELALDIRGLDERVGELLQDYPWPGNVGELENVIRRAAVLARGDVIASKDLGDSLTEGWFVGREEAESALEVGVRRAWRQRLAERKAGRDGSPFHEIIAIAEEVLTREALAETSGNQVKASELLGITRTTLRKKMSLIGLL